MWWALVHVVALGTVVAGMSVEWVLTLMVAHFDQIFRGQACGVPELRRGDRLEPLGWQEASAEAVLLEGFLGRRSSVVVATVLPEQLPLFFSGVDPCPRNLSSAPSIGTNSPS